VTTQKIGLWSGVGLTLADMVGTGVLTTAGFMALDLTPLCQADSMSLVDYCAELLTAFSRDIQDRIARFQRSEAETHQPSKQE